MNLFCSVEPLLLLFTSSLRRSLAFAVAAAAATDDQTLSGDSRTFFEAAK